jgi:hypothetical protein
MLENLQPETKEYLNITKILDVIIDYDSYLYKINNGYEKYSSKIINDIYEELSKLSV